MAGRAGLFLIKRAPNRTIMLNIKEKKKPSIKSPKQLTYKRAIDFPADWPHYGFGWYDLLIIALSAPSTIDRWKIHRTPPLPRFPRCPGNCTSGFSQLLQLSLGKVCRVKPGLLGSDLMRVVFTLFLWFHCDLYTCAVTFKYHLLLALPLAAMWMSVLPQSRGLHKVI